MIKFHSGNIMLLLCIALSNVSVIAMEKPLNYLRSKEHWINDNFSPEEADKLKEWRNGWIPEWENSRHCSPELKDALKRFKRAYDTCNKKALEAWLKLGSPLNAPIDYLGRTALLQAVYDRNDDVAEWLFKNGANPNQKDLKGLTVWDHNFIGGSGSENFELLAEYGTDPNISSGKWLPLEHLLCWTQPTYSPPDVRAKVLSTIETICSHGANIFLLSPHPAYLWTTKEQLEAVKRGTITYEKRTMQKICSDKDSYLNRLPKSLASLLESYCKNDILLPTPARYMLSLFTNKKCFLSKLPKHLIEQSESGRPSLKDYCPNEFNDIDKGWGLFDNECTIGRVLKLQIKQGPGIAGTLYLPKN